MRPRALALLVIASLATAGCLTDDAADPEGPAGPLRASELPDRLSVLEGLSVPAFDGMAVSAWHREFVTTFVKRDTQSPTNLQAAEFLRTGLAELGYDASIRTYVPPRDGLPLPTEPTPGVGVRVVIGVKQGVEPGHVVAWVSHYDTQTLTVQGAYDDGSGVATGFELARLFAEHDNNKTLMAIFFDAEEIGLVGSNAFVRDVLGREDVVFDMVVGHDMVGINWPGHPWKMYQFMAECYVDDLRPVQEAIYHEHLEWPSTGIAILDTAPRNSDERRFKDQGVPVVRMAGGLNASDYPEYHRPDDTVDFLYEFVGGEANWAAGLETVLAASWWNVAYWDRAAPLAPADPACYA